MPVNMLISYWFFVSFYNSGTQLEIAVLKLESIKLLIVALDRYLYCI